MRAGLVGEHVGADAALEELGQDLGGVAEQPDRHGLPRCAGALDDLERLVDALGAVIDVTRAQAHVDARTLALDREARRAGHHGGQRLRATHAAEARGQQPAPGETAGVMLPTHLDERLVRSLHDALRADVDPRARGHLAVHHEPLAVELVEMLPGAPARHEIGVCEQDAWGVRMRFEHADGFAGLDQQSLVGLESPERRDDRIVALPVARGAPDAAVHHELLGAFGHRRIEVVHEHAQRRFGEPALGGKGGSMRRADHACPVDAGHSTPSVVEPNTRQASSTVLSAARSGAACCGSYGVGQLSSADRACGLAHVAAAGELHLDGVHAARGFAVIPRDPAALEAAVGPCREPGQSAHRFDGYGEIGAAALAAVGADVELRQLTIEQTGYARADGMRVVEHDARMHCAQPLELGQNRLVVGHEPGFEPLRDIVRIRLQAGQVQRLVVEGRERAQVGGVRARVERLAGGIAIHVDDGARHHRADGGDPEVGREIVQLVHPPVGVLARAPRRDELRFDLHRDRGSGVRQAQHHGSVAAPYPEPVFHRPLQTRECSGFRPR